MAEVTLYAFEDIAVVDGTTGRIDGINPVPIRAVRNSDGTYSISSKAFIQFTDSPSIDAFARARISEPFTLFDNKQIWNDPSIADNAENYPLFYDNQEVSGGGTTTLFNVNRASTILGVSNLTAGKRTRQTKQRFNYEPGKSMLVIMTGKFGNTGTGITKQLGFFDDNDGLFFRDDAGIWSFVVRSNVSGTPLDTVVPQSDWNLDKLDGNGNSGLVLNKSAVQIFLIDFEWLGSGRIRFGFFIDGIPVYCHQEVHANISPSVYMSNPNLPVRVTIENDGSGAADTVEEICSTVISEGGVKPNGISRGGDLGTAAASVIQAATVNTAYAICGIRLKPNYLSAKVDITNLSIIEVSTATDDFLWRLLYNPTLTTGLTYSGVPNSAVEFGVGLAAGDAVIDQGAVIASGYASKSVEAANFDIASAIRLGAAINGTRDEFILVGIPGSVNQDFLGGLVWREAW